MPFFIERNDITKVKCDAIVNAANNSLLGGGGVDGAIHYAAGPELLKECITLGGCETGKAKITKGYNLPAKYVIHTVGPVWDGGNDGEEELLRSCYRNSLILAEENKCSCVAFPLISSGVYGYPFDEAINVAKSEILKFLENSDMTVKLILFGNVKLPGGRYANEIKEYINSHYIEDGNVLYAPINEGSLEMGEVFEFAKPHAKKSKAVESDNLSVGALCDEAYELDEGYFDMILRLIDESGMTDAECYKRANIDRKYFNKMKNLKTYRPKKSIIMAFAFALKLDIAQTEELLKKAGFALSDSILFDVICKKYIEKGDYDIFDANISLAEYDLEQLGNIQA